VARKLAILKRATADVSAAHIAWVEDLMLRRVRQNIAEMLAEREVDPSAGFVQPQIVRLSDAMQVTPAREPRLAQPAAEARGAETFRLAKP
jgi:hypothetical protein